MRNYLLLFLAVSLFSCERYLQAANTGTKTPTVPRVEVTNWGKVSMYTTEDFWNNNKQQIINQIGVGEYEKMRVNIGWKNIPQEMTIWNGKEKRNRTELHEKLSKLNVSRIATVNHQFQGKDWGNYAILRCSYSENKNWIPNVRWDTVYFLVEGKAVRIVN